METFLVFMSSLLFSNSMSEAAWVWKDDTQIVQNKPAISFLDVLGGSKTIQTIQVNMHNNNGLFYFSIR